MSKIVMQDKEFLYENASIPVINKLQDNDVNNFKNAINQEGSFTSCNFGNSSYSCNLIGTLSTGDIIQVLLPLSNQNSSNDSDISISIDGGTTYYNLLDKTQEFNLKASDFEYNDIYLRAVFNGSNFVLISPDRVKSYIVLQISAEQSMSSSNNNYVINYDTVLYQKGERLTKAIATGSANGVKVGVGVKNIRVSQAVQANNNNASSDMYFLAYVYVAGSIASRCITPAIVTGASVGITNATLSMPVSENDTIYGQVYKSRQTGIATIGTGARTQLIVEEI